MCEKNKKPKETIELTDELTDDQLDKATGGFAYQGDPLPPVESYSMKQCPNGHIHVMWTEKCPECGSDKYTIVSMSAP